MGRQGKALRKHQTELVGELLPSWLSISPSPSTIRGAVWRPVRETRLEIGFGAANI